MNTNDLVPQDFLLAALDKVLLYSEQQKQHKAEEVLPHIFAIVEEYPHILWNTPHVWKLAKAYMILYHYDAGDDEQRSMTIVKQAYMYAIRAVELCEKIPEYTCTDMHFNALHTQIMLLSTCEDVFVGALADVYVHLHASDARIHEISTKLAQKIMPIITYNMLVKVDDTFEQFNHNEVLEAMCNEFELDNPDITPKQLNEADKVHTILIHSFLRDCFSNQK